MHERGSGLLPFLLPSKNFGLVEVVLTCEGFVVICVLCWNLKTPELVLFDFSIVDVVYTINSLHLPS